MPEAAVAARRAPRARGRARAKAAGSVAVFETAFGVAVALLLFGDYLALTISRALTGSSGNWILFTAIAQGGVLALAFVLGRLRGRLPWSLLAGYGCLFAVMLAHALGTALAGNQLDVYAEQKVLAGAFLIGPAILCGIALGRSAGVPGSRWLVPMLAPLLVMCALAAATDARQLTIAYFDALPIWFGFMVMPAHQGLACCVAKGAVAAFALAGGERGRRLGSILMLGLVGVLIGLTLLSGARGYTLALAAALAAQLLVGRRRVGIALLATVIAVALFQTMAPELIYDRFDVDQVSESLAYREREEAWTTAWAAFADSPWIGQGPGGFARAMNSSVRTYPHNIVLEVACELGIVGVLAFALMIVPVVSRTARALVRGQAVGKGQVFAIGMLVFGFCGAMSVGDLIRNHFVFLGLGMAASALPAAAWATGARERPVLARAAGRRRVAVG